MSNELIDIYRVLPYVVGLSFVLGCVPFGPFVSGLKGVDLRSVGSGNVGATNVYRALGKEWAVIVFAADVLKGLLPVVVTVYMFEVPILGMLAGIAAVTGHIFNPLYDFKGGKGVATSFGAMLGIFPLAALLALFTWSIVVYQTRIVSLAGITASLSLPFFTLLTKWDLAYIRSALLAAFVLSALTVFAHRENIERLLSGEEKETRREEQE